MNVIFNRSHAGTLGRSINDRTATVAVIGLGYVGLPLAATIARSGFRVVGFDIDATKIEMLVAGHSYIDAVADSELQTLMGADRFTATNCDGRLAGCDIVIICVPTPLTKNREPDLSFVRHTSAMVARHLRHGQLIILESTSYPGTTEEIVKPALESGGLRCGRDFFLGYSPEREDPGNTQFSTTSIPKVVAGDDMASASLVTAFYGSVVETVVPVSSVKVAEVVKLTENIFRSVNIALVNELKVVYGEMGIDIWEVIEAAKTKPFGYMPFYPGPGLGGHCIPVDPLYLTWKSREFETPTRFIELAGEVNMSMPGYVVDKLIRALDEKLGLPLSQASVLIVGVAYKKNVSDLRESPALKIIEMLAPRVADLAYHDPFVARLPKAPGHPLLAGKSCLRLSPDAIAAYDVTVILTDHDNINYSNIAKFSRLVVDTRNVIQRNGIVCDRLVKA